MRSFSKNRRRPRVEQLEDRCVPGSVLDLLANPVLPLGDGQSMDPLQADQTAVLLPEHQATDMSGQAARPGDALIPEPVASGLASGAESSSQPSSGASAAGILVAAPGLSMEATEGIVGSESAHEVPFKGRLEGDVTVTPPPPPLGPPFVSVYVEAAGNATHLGQFTLEIPHLVNRQDKTAFGKYEFTAANGDTLTADFHGKARPTATPGVLSIVETATITGGTGRFAGATGGFTCQRLFDTVAGTTTGSFEGTISQGR
jgi:hypothetical protein